MMEGETAAMRDMPEDLRKLLGNYEGLRSPDLLPQADARALQAHAHDITAAAGLTRAAELSQLPLLADELGSEEPTSELQSLMRNQYAAFCLKTKNHTTDRIQQ